MLDVFLSTGYNKNYMYLEQTAHTLPNGLVRLLPDNDVCVHVKCMLVILCILITGDSEY